MKRMNLQRAVLSCVAGMAVFALLALPVISIAADSAGIVPCDNSTNNICDFQAFFKLVDNFIKFVLFKLGLPVGAFMCGWAGFIMVTAGEEAAQARTKAKKIFFGFVFGYCIAAAAYLIVKFFFYVFGFKAAFVGL